MAEHGPDLAAAKAAAAELDRRGDERQARPFAGLSPQDLANEIANVEDDLADLEQCTDNLVARIGAWEQQAASWDQQADAVDWEKPAWTRHTEDRQAETAAGARLTELAETLDRSALRGGPRGRERAQLEAEAGRIRQANPALAADTDHTALWDERGETAWAEDRTAAQDLRSKAGHARSQAASAREELPGITDNQQGLRDRLEKLTNETRMRPGDAAFPTAQSARQFERSRPKRSLNSTDTPSGLALDPGPPIALEPERRPPPQR